MPSQSLSDSIRVFSYSSFALISFFFISSVYRIRVDEERTISRSVRPKPKSMDQKYQLTPTMLKNSELPSTMYDTKSTYDPMKYRLIIRIIYT